MDSFDLFDRPILLFSVIYFLFLPFGFSEVEIPPLKWPKPCGNGCFTYSH